MFDASLQGSQGVPLWSILVFPALFTAGMALIDTTDGALMIGAYGWAFVKPIRKLYDNMTIPGRRHYQPGNPPAFHACETAQKGRAHLRAGPCAVLLTLPLRAIATPIRGAYRPPQREKRSRQGGKSAGWR